MSVLESSDQSHQTRIEVDTEVELKAKKDAGNGELQCSNQSSTDQNPDYDSDYEREKDCILQHMTKVQSQMECQRSRQMELLRQRKEMKKAGTDQSQEMANKLIGHVIAAEDQRVREKERQRQLLKNRLDERRRRKSESGMN